MLKVKKHVERCVSPMKIAILDDDPMFVKELQQKISMGCAKRDWGLKCVSFSNPQELLAFDLSNTQVVFLDIDIPETNGIEVASQIRQRYTDIILVFVTGYIQFAPAGYKVNAFRYILKGSLDKEIGSCLDAIQDKLFERKETILIETRDSQLEIALQDILYFEGTPYRRTLLFTIHSDDQVIECRGKINEYEERLVGKGFIRLQKSFLANMRHINKISSYTAKLRNGKILKVSEKDYKKICAEYLMWKGNRL